MFIEKNKVVSLTYKLRFDNADGDIIEEIDDINPEVVLIGHENLFEKFEEKILKLKAGDEFEFILNPEDSYGEYDDEKLIDLPKENFMIDGEFDEEMVYEGAIIPMEDEENDIHAEAIVLEIDNENVKLDFNHPLAGETLHFKGNILLVRDATEEEIKFGDVTE
ncbi:MAG: FKBP-type peptidyl-prolyl cis-trans isomerase [Bacteroidales bacterium]